MALAHFKEPGLQNKLHEIPWAYSANALRTPRSQPSVDPGHVSVMGGLAWQ